MNFVRYLLENSNSQDKLFVTGDHGTLTYPELVKKLAKLSSLLYNRYGTRKKFLVMADNSPFFILSYLSIIASGNRRFKMRMVAKRFFKETSRRGLKIEAKTAVLDSISRRW